MPEHEHFTRNKLKTLQHDEVIEIALNLQTQVTQSIGSLSEEIKKLTETFTKEIKDLKETFHQKFERIQSELIISQNTTSLLERQCSRLDQYSRRECLEIKGIPKEIENDGLIDYIAPICKDILDVDISGINAIQACHRLSSRSDDVIIKFSNRDDRNAVIRNRK